MRSRKIVALIGAVITVAASASIFGSGAASAKPACPAMYVVAIPGTWETSDHGRHRPAPGMLAHVTRGLPGDIRTAYVTYAATAFPWEGDVYGRSRAEAVHKATGMIGAMARRCPASRIGIIGFSQGADAAGDVAAQIGTGHGVVPPNRVTAVGLLSDPSRSPLDPMVGSPVIGAGAEGPRPGGFGYVTPVVRSICAPTDLYCATASNNYAMRFAGFLAGISDFNPADLLDYQREFGLLMGDVMHGGGIGMLQSQFTDAANERRARQLQRFYNSGVHSDYMAYDVGDGMTATEWLHDYLVRQA